MSARSKPTRERRIERVAAGISRFLQRRCGVWSNIAEERGAQRDDGLARERDEAVLLQIDRGHAVSPEGPFTRRSSSASSIVSTPSCFAFSSLLPASAPTTTKPVFFDTLLDTRPPFDSTNAAAASRDN